MHVDALGCEKHSSGEHLEGTTSGSLKQRVSKLSVQEHHLGTCTETQLPGFSGLLGGAATFAFELNTRSSSAAVSLGGSHLRGTAQGVRTELPHSADSLRD